VRIEAFGAEPDLEHFLTELRSDTLPSARIVELRESAIPERDESGFRILQSDGVGDKTLSIPPDLATCADCEREVFDDRDRRHRYPFTNCTSCGPRFTIATGIPYDRALTTMASFVMCAECQREFQDVEDRRFHAQPNACPRCGPSLQLLGFGDDLLMSRDPLQETATLLRAGAIVAIKGLGGFHLACDATNGDAITRLRERKRRDEKPFAVMARNLDEAEKLARISESERVLLTSQERPIVLVLRNPAGAIAPAACPDTPLLGLFLPYTPLHQLLLEEAGGPLVMTSANLSDEPICRSDEEARRRLDGIADALLLHDREIAMRCDDSVARVVDGVPTLLRRSRGFVPRPFPLKRPVAEPILACGAHLKNTFCIAHEDSAYLGPHIGDLETVAALEFFEQAVERMQAILSVRPKVIAHDLHPGYLSTRYAMSRSDVQRVGVQHHHAHVVSAMAEHGVEGPVLGLAFDGTGLGDDESSWGGEFLFCFRGHYERLATFRPIRLPGGNVAMKEIWRVAYSLVHDAYDGQPPIESMPLFGSIPATRRGLVAQMLERDLNAPQAHGVGRYFDAFAALGLRRPWASYEAQAAIAWEFAAASDEDGHYPFELDESASPLQIDLRPTVRAAVDELASGVEPGQVSARFHNTLVDASGQVVVRLLRDRDSVPIVLTGGVFQNATLSAGIHKKLSHEYEVLRHSSVPAGDGGIALGQALIADAILGDKG
jgi:hydrogenase maturation protein HypF